MSAILVKSQAKETTVIATATVIEAVPGEVYNLIDQANGKTPEDIKATRKGNDLILRSDALDAQVTLKDFWGNCQPGEEQCFATLDILASDGSMGQVTITQTDNVLTYLLAGEIGTLAETTVPIWLFAGLGVLGMAALAGGGSSSTTAPGKIDKPLINIEKDGGGVGLFTYCCGGGKNQCGLY